VTKCSIHIEVSRMQLTATSYGLKAKTNEFDNLKGVFEVS